MFSTADASWAFAINVMYFFLIWQEILKLKWTKTLFSISSYAQILNLRTKNTNQLFSYNNGEINTWLLKIITKQNKTCPLRIWYCGCFSNWRNWLFWYFRPSQRIQINMRHSVLIQSFLHHSFFLKALGPPRLTKYCSHKNTNVQR